MGFLSRLNPFKHKKKEDSDYSSMGLSRPELGSGTRPQFNEPRDVPLSMPSRAPATNLGMVTNESVTIDNIRAKMELMATQIDSMRMQQESINQRIVDIETMVKQLLIMAKE